MTQNSEFTLLDILYLIKKRLVLIASLTVLLAICGYLGSKYLIVPQYESTATLIVNINPDKESSYNDLAFSQKLVEIYAVILKNQTLLKKVISDLKIPVSSGTLANSITINEIGSTGIMKVSVRDTDPARAKAIAYKIVDLAPDEISRTVKTGTVELISPPQDAYYVSPNNRRNMFIGAFAGLLLSLTITFLLEFLNNKFITGEDIKTRIGYPVLGVIPYSRIMEENYKSSSEDLFKKVPFQIAESFNGILTNLKYAAIDKPIKKLLITSSVPGEGKSSVALNLALALAQLGKKVLLMDMDLRKSDSPKHFKLKNTKYQGITSVLANSCSLSDAIVKNKNLGIDILTSGPTPPNPIVMLQSIAIKNMFAELEKNYDYILIDTPPVSVFSDALTLLPLADGVIFVVRQNFTTFESAVSSKNQFDNTKANILGCILNSFKYTKSNKPYPYYFQYRYHDDS